MSPNGSEIAMFTSLMLGSNGATQQIVAREPNQRASHRQLACIAVSCGRVNSDVRGHTSRLEALIRGGLSQRCDEAHSLTRVRDSS